MTSPFTYAGQWGPEALVSGGAGNDALLLPAATPVTVFLTDGVTQATLYTDKSKATGATNPIVVDTAGNATFFADPGVYILSWTIAGSTSTATVEVGPHPQEIADMIASSGQRVLGTTTTTRPTAPGAYAIFNSPSDPGSNAFINDLAVADGWG